MVYFPCLWHHFGFVVLIKNICLLVLFSLCVFIWLLFLLHFEGALSLLGLVSPFSLSLVHCLLPLSLDIFRIWRLVTNYLTICSSCSAVFTHLSFIPVFVFALCHSHSLVYCQLFYVYAFSCFFGSPLVLLIKSLVIPFPCHLGPSTATCSTAYMRWKFSEVFVGCCFIHRL